MPYVTAWFKASEVTYTVLLDYLIKLQSLKMLQDVFFSFSNWPYSIISCSHMLNWQIAKQVLKKIPQAIWFSNHLCSQGLLSKLVQWHCICCSTRVSAACSVTKVKFQCQENCKESMRHFRRVSESLMKQEVVCTCFFFFYSQNPQTACNILHMTRHNPSFTLNALWSNVMGMRGFWMGITNPTASGILNSISI